MKIEDYFTKPDFTVPKRLICVAEGMPKVGKTTLGLSAAALGGVAYLNWDWGEEGVIHKAPKRENILECKFIPPMTMWLDDDTTHTQYKAAWNRAKDAYLLALTSPQFKTIVVDTASEQYESCRLAHHGKLEKVLARDYGPVNADMRRLLRAAVEATDKNVIFIAKHKDEYVNDKPTGRKIAAGFKEINYLAQIVVECYRNGATFGIRVLDSKHKPELNGKEFQGCDFPMLLTLVHG